MMAGAPVLFWHHDCDRSGASAGLDTTVNGTGRKLGFTQLRKFLTDTTDTLHQAFREGQSVRQLVAARAFTVDQVLHHLWTSLEWPEDCQAALIAVGGYGRAELFPHSDVDILILLTDEKALQQVKSPGKLYHGFVGFETDVGHSVRTLKDSEEQARQDITIGDQPIGNPQTGGESGLVSETARSSLFR